MSNFNLWMSDLKFIGVKGCEKVKYFCVSIQFIFFYDFFCFNNILRLVLYILFNFLKGQCDATKAA